MTNCGASIDCAWVCPGCTARSLCACGLFWVYDDFGYRRDDKGRTHRVSVCEVPR